MKAFNTTIFSLYAKKFYILSASSVGQGSPGNGLYSMQCQGNRCVWCLLPWPIYCVRAMCFKIIFSGLILFLTPSKFVCSWALFFVYKKFAPLPCAADQDMGWEQGFYPKCSNPEARLWAAALNAGCDTKKGIMVSSLCLLPCSFWPVLG